MTYDVAIIGGGPAGVAAGIYAARKKLSTILLTYDFGGQSTVSPDIQNWIGTKSISGTELARSLKEHLLAYEGPVMAVKTGVKVKQVAPEQEIFKITTESGETYEAKTVLVATGAKRRKLNVPGADTYEQKGITYCATCDAPMFSGKEVAVLGGGNAAFETALQLTSYCPKITIIERADSFKADRVTVEKVLATPGVRAITGAETVEFKGDKFLKSLVYKDLKTGTLTELPVEGVFVEIGTLPATEFLGTQVKTNSFGSVMVDPRTQRTSLPGIWAAGDCTDALYHQNNIAAGDAIKALEDIYYHLNLQ
jgi:alkyl hydroperoxide reductase subunit F